MRAGIRNPDGELVAIPRALRAFPRCGHSQYASGKSLPCGPCRAALARLWRIRAGRARSGRRFKSLGLSRFDCSAGASMLARMRVFTEFNQGMLNI